MATKLARLLSGTAPVLFSFILCVLALLGCSSPSDETGTPSTDSATTPDTAITPTDAMSESDAPVADVGSDADVALETNPSCAQGEMCTELGKWCGSLICTECGATRTWQNVPHTCDADVADADGSSDGDVPSDVLSDVVDTFYADAADTLDSKLPETSVDSGDTSAIPDTSDTSPPDTEADTTPPPDTKPADTGPDDTGVTDTGPTDTGPPKDATPDSVAIDTGTGDSTVTDTGPTDTGTDTGDVTVTDTFDSMVIETSVTDSDADSGSDVADATDADGSTDTAPVKFSCTGWIRDATFDALKIDGFDVQLVGGIWGTSSSNIYVSAATHSKGVVAHWNGTSWVKEDLPTPPIYVGGIWGTSDDNVWLAARGSAAAALYKRSGGTWSLDLTAPFAKGFQFVWGTSDGTEMYLTGWKSGESMVFRKTSSTAWTKQTLPAPTSTDYRGLVYIWGLDGTNVFVTGYYANTVGDATKGILYRFDGMSWTDVKVPTECIEVGIIHGTSVDDLWVTCSKDATTGIVYQVSSKLATWIAKVSKTMVYGPVWSKRSGTALAIGYEPGIGAGSLRVTTIDEVSAPSTSSVDSKAYNPVTIWPAPGSSKVHFGHIATSGTFAGFYTGTCD